MSDTPAQVSAHECFREENLSTAAAKLRKVNSHRLEVAVNWKIKQEKRGRNCLIAGSCEFTSKKEFS